MKSGFKSPVWVFETRNFFRFEINQDLKKWNSEKAGFHFTLIEPQAAIP